MKFNIQILLMSAALMLTSCNDSFLDRMPHDRLTDANFWQTEQHLRSVTNTFTNSLAGKEWLNKTEIAADSAPWAVSTAWRNIGGGYFTSDISNINSVWYAAYSGIGKTNYFLNNYNRATGVKEEVRERYAAEAYFYRAYNYWILTSFFGDVPLITEELNVESPDVYRGRDKRADVIDRITKDLEDHYKALPEYIAAGSADFGHVSQTAAHAVSACERAMNSTYYKLYNTGNPESDYIDLFTYKGRASRNSENHETILAFVYNYDLGETARTSHNLSRECWVPNDYARFVPTASMIECYLTKDGQIWNPDSATSYEDVFKDRDPRMTQSILTPGTKWEGGASGDKLNTDKTVFTYPKFDNSKNGCMTYTGYYMRKYVEPETVKFVGHDDNDIIFIRYAEVLLNYAEAKEQLGTLTQTDLNKSINLLRDRVGMVHMTLTPPAGSDIRTEIRRERRVELFFEGQRYFDIIRWKQGDLLGKPLLGVRKDYLDPSRLEIKLSDLKWKSVNGKEYLILEANRTFDAGKNYLLPIPFTQMQMNPNLAPNNPGWD